MKIKGILTLPTDIDELTKNEFKKQWIKACSGNLSPKTLLWRSPFDGLPKFGGDNGDPPPEPVY
jgi:hypothetical protein